MRGLLSVLPAIQRHLRMVFRNLAAADREEAIAEATAAAWVSYVRMVQRGREHLAFASSLARFAALHVRNGRQVAGPSGRDALSRASRQRHDFEVTSLDGPPAQWKEAVLQDTRSAPVPEIVRFRLDFAAWLQQLSRRDRRIAERLALRYSTTEVAEKFRLSPGRISQLRRELCESWCRFQGDLLAAAPRAAPAA